MSNPFAETVRRVAAELLPPGAFLRRDRGEALFVTDAPLRAPETDWTARFGEVGFACRIEGGLARLTPDARWLQRLADAYPEPPDDLCASLRRFDGPVDAPSLHLFARGLKALDAGTRDDGFSRAVRQRAAVCLRDSTQSGGGLYACALLQTLMEGERET